ncbi:hypothetical protein OPW39_15580 [Vibrio europaeus]|uniref:hypothetical protein n=1 Tax=Vibrio europaeus TaxID=300876 RepID=UPI00233EF51F|nr:hypothetical protein [Vibrio europaeus]MDC5870228.1 hypothetical protein [Vibrio europaeus]
MTKYYKVTEKELYALIAVADTVDAMKGCGDEGIENEANESQKAIKAIGKRHGIEFVRDYSNTEIKY